jgi:hypothetical protein
MQNGIFLVHPAPGRCCKTFFPAYSNFILSTNGSFFLIKKDKQNEFPFSGPQINVQYVWAGMNMLSNLFVLPRHMRKLKIGIMISQTFPSFSSNSKSIVFIHDVLFNDYPQFFTWKERLYFSLMSCLNCNRSDLLIAITEYVSKI